MNQIKIPVLPEMNELWQESMNWVPNDSQQQHFQRLYQLILEGNRSLNLTRITEPIEFWEKHLWDSLRGIARLLPVNDNLGEIREFPPQSLLKAIDIGTGGGFPGLPVAIALPTLSVTLLDSTRKKIDFLDTVLPSLAVKNAATLLGRSDEVWRQPPHKAAYNLAFLRAVGAASVCGKYALPFLKNGGLAVLYRGNWTVEEETELQSAIEPLGGTVESVEAFTTPVSHSVRHCVYLRKVV
ncbi:MAG: 16S rRNA (guanine(527)-N(7))-methyltransferase RsmG [Oscillatoriales cyanobacterium]|uniref:Ribosomal RNA small subunit methyltransferase G n=1 Tax=Microcoleus anatoxicus PTRS2 TaxID=2705321 RepID=A0ABU8YJH8_9CYAN|nr:MAG: 16S rRNA (guanine(527)-N(7))-methyltransferase RsmG [Oscillatoriales cyanobacterium]TAD95595.1 MAG: 16S rRNA (guanine(527)-N(7))-methyltransferase RsmG [Oscillatoriales cyanobacterium]TAF06540.1 MAG: 16S rRNA (guanine(527)-N(7))-methyltransferase RsmG [Oscillatoriales cyanobacterium]TAF36084.1 MAG: 16S rRNA (guanine(527)-N(7))-methyltransferase RsmG [Oscillatoriales cyanobacterium]TAF66614.1 MAG: 16S rRNA (guanine(527)-N(7))-methyltransferase RsmG [Oscillatoriales cyanobacterium]